MAMIEVNHLNFAYDNQEVLKDLCFSVEKGTLTCLLGNNGSGKTTLLDCILGIHPYHQGQIELFGKDIKKIPVNKRAERIAYIPQKHHESFPYTVEEIVLMGRNPYLKTYQDNKADDYEKVKEALKLMLIEPLKERIFSQLSEGEMKMVLIARAYVQDTDIILMDEPTASLDLKNERLLLERIEYMLREKNKTIIMSSHSINHPLFLSGRGAAVQVIMLKNGRITYKGTVDETIVEENILDTYGVATKLLHYTSDAGREGRSVVTL